MTPTVQVFERVSRHAPFGLRLWDIAGATDLVDGLDIEVSARADSQSSVRAFVNRSGVYSVAGLPGLRRFELGEADDDAAFNAALRRYRVTVRDPQGRFLPFAFDADLPARGLFTWLPPDSPPQPLLLPTDHGSPPGPMIGRVPLFSAPSRAEPGPVASVRTQLRELGGERAAAWALLTASIDSLVQGIGLADEEGRVAVLFPYPDRPRRTLTSPPPAVNDFRWSVELTAYYIPRPADTPAPAIPDLADVLAQLASPQVLFRSTVSPPQALPALPLEYRGPLTVRTETTATGPSSFLFVNAA